MLIRNIPQRLPLRHLGLDDLLNSVRVDRYRVLVSEESHPQEAVILDAHHFTAHQNIIAVFDFLSHVGYLARAAQEAR